MVVSGIRGQGVVMYATVLVCMCSCICACVCVYVCSGLSSAEIRKKEKRSFRLTSLATRVGSLGNRKRERERESKKGVELRERGGGVSASR